MTECRSGCGACCDPVMLPYSVAEAVHLNLPPREKLWVLHELTPISRREAKERVPWQFLSKGYAVDRDGNPIMQFFYDCHWFDPETRECLNWEQRPDVCRGFPFYGDVPARNALLPPTCSYRVDIGQPVEDIPVTFTKRERPRLR